MVIRAARENRPAPHVKRQLTFGLILYEVMTDISTIPVAFVVGGLAGTIASGIFLKSQTAN